MARDVGAVVHMDIDCRSDILRAIYVRIVVARNIYSQRWWQKMTAKRIIAIVLSLVIIASFVFLIIWGVKNQQKLSDTLNGLGVYGKDDVQNAYEEGYNTAFDDRAQYEALMAEYDQKLADYEQIKSDLAVARNEVNVLQDKVTALQDYVQSCEALIKKLEQENASLQAEIKTLQEINKNLMASINAYIQLIASIGVLEERFVVTFMFDDTVYSILLVPKGDKVELVNPVSTEYTIFLGWSLSADGDLVDLQDIVIDKDTVIYAKIIRKYDVNFVLDYKLFDHQIVAKGQTATAGTPESTPRRAFVGWSLNGVDIVDVSSERIMEHRTYFAVVEERYEVKFVYVRNGLGYGSYTEVLSTQYVGASDKIQPPTEMPQFEHYQFAGWYINGSGALVNNQTLEHYTPTADVVISAYYKPDVYVYSSHHMESGSSTFDYYHSINVYDIIKHQAIGSSNTIANVMQLGNFVIRVEVEGNMQNAHLTYGYITITPESPQERTIRVDDRLYVRYKFYPSGELEVSKAVSAGASYSYASFNLSLEFKVMPF